VAALAGMGATLSVEIAFAPVAPGASAAPAPAATGLVDRRRLNDAYQIRLRAAQAARKVPLPLNPSNLDELLYPTRIASYSKALPHNQLGEVDLRAYQALADALASGAPTDFERIPLGGSVRLTNPQAAYAFVLEGLDSHQFEIAVPPTFRSAGEAAEIAECYWMALARDIPFAEYSRDALIDAAARNLSTFSGYAGPKSGGRVTPSTIFRGTTAGDLTGPFVSQFLWQTVPYGAVAMAQQIRTAAPQVDYLASYDAWLAVQNGAPGDTPAPPDPAARHLRSGRDLAEFVHRDFSYQAGLSACMILLSYGRDALDPANPYLTSATQDGFVTFGGPDVVDAMARVTSAAMKAAWFLKWLVHRRLRPEEFAGRVHNYLQGRASYPIHRDLLTAPGRDVLDAVHAAQGSYLLSSAYPEGAPPHPAYPSGHATFAGACVTVLKAFFNESYLVPNPVEASADGRALLPYRGPPLTVGGELNKLAANVAVGRLFAGIHWRSDASEGMRLGEEVAIRCLRDQRLLLNESFRGFSLTRFDGTVITV